jgi:hypothetical protein
MFHTNLKGLSHEIETGEEKAFEKICVGRKAAESFKKFPVCLQFFILKGLSHEIETG